MQSSRVLVVAPDADLRDSLCFALRTHGYIVASQAGFGAAPDASDYDCVVVHEKALAEHNSMPSGESVLLLSYSAEHRQQIETNVLRMPIMGNELVEAVSQLIANRKRSRQL